MLAIQRVLSIQLANAMGNKPATQECMQCRMSGSPNGHSAGIVCSVLAGSPNGHSAGIVCSVLAGSPNGHSAGIVCSGLANSG